MFCRIYQSAIEKDLDTFGSVQRPSLVSHLRKCSRCRVFYHRMTQLERQLRASPSCDVSDEQLERIRDAVRQRLSETTPTQTNFTVFQPQTYFRMRYAIPAAAAIVLVSLIGLYYLQHIRSTVQDDPMAWFVSNSTTFQNRMSLLARIPEQSIQTEMRKLANDAQSAVNFIGNCIPANPAGQYDLDADLNSR